MSPQFIAIVIRDCIEYAQQYGCSFTDAVCDWEGDGPDGSFGLTPEERDEILQEYK